MNRREAESRTEVARPRGNGLLDLQRRLDRTPGVVLERYRRAEEGHNAIPEELIDSALVAVHRVQENREDLVH